MWWHLNTGAPFNVDLMEILTYRKEAVHSLFVDFDKITRVYYSQPSVRQTMLVVQSNDSRQKHIISAELY